MKTFSEIKKIIRGETSRVLKNQGIALCKVILFGSRARGDFDEESDWDVLVLADKDLTPSEKIRLWYEIYKALHRKMRKSSFDVIVKSEAEYSQEKDVVNTISNEAATEGVVL